MTQFVFFRSRTVDGKRLWRTTKLNFTRPHDGMTIGKGPGPNGCRMSITHQMSSLSPIEGWISCTTSSIAFGCRDMSSAFVTMMRELSPKGAIQVVGCTVGQDSVNIRVCLCLRGRSDILVVTVVSLLVARICGDLVACPEMVSWMIILVFGDKNLTNLCKCVFQHAFIVMAALSHAWFVSGVGHSVFFFVVGACTFWHSKQSRSEILLLSNRMDTMDYRKEVEALRYKQKSTKKWMSFTNRVLSGWCCLCNDE